MARPHGWLEQSQRQNQSKLWGEGGSLGPGVGGLREGAHVSPARDMQHACLWRAYAGSAPSVTHWLAGTPPGVVGSGGGLQWRCPVDAVTQHGGGQVAGL